jgi:hypothetical protein
MKIFSIHQQQIRLGDDLEILFFIDRLVNQDQQERKSDFSINIFLCVQRLFFLRFVFLYVLFAQEKHIHTHTHTQRCSFLHHQSFTFIALCVLYFAFFLLLLLWLFFFSVLRVSALFDGMK